MPFPTLLTSLTFYHLSLLTFLLGAQIYQSFFANIAAFNALNRAQFRTLQAAIWPMYFKLQTSVCILLALTYPGGDAESVLFYGSASVQGLFDRGARWTVLLPLLNMIIFSSSNMLYAAPMTHSAMLKVHLETVREEKARGITSSESPDDDDEKNNFESVRDRKAIQADGPKSPELKALTNRFLAFHAASYVLNMATIAASVFYALCITARGL